MKKKESNRKIIELGGDPNKEQAYIKPTRGELIDITKESGKGWVKEDYKKIKRFLRGKKGFKLAHTHPYPGKGIPSDQDLYNAIKNSKRNKKGNLGGRFILQRDKNTGEWRGTTYYIPKNNRKNFEREFKKWNEKVYSKGEDYIPSAKELLNLAKSLGVDLRFHPTRGHYFDKETGEYEKKQHNLEGVVGSILIGIVLTFLFVKISFTGSVVMSDIVISKYKIGFSILFVLLFSSVTYFLLKPYKKNMF